ncbi:Cullin binding-domain-containing protein [Limtongia smithiae]|uniref:Cullin binding-domain-containing protein n=1 Tax=Limtongia smithiae TaxID=1125753 RepID=UPI0034CF5036
MSSFSTAQRNAIAQFLQTTGVTSSRTAASYLRASNWNLNSAISEFFETSGGVGSNGGSRGSLAKETKALTQIFEKYQDPENTSIIGIDGTISFIQELDVALEDPVVLALACKLDASTVGQFSKDGFIKGWISLSADTIPKMKAAVDKLRTDLANDPAFFKQVYKFTFGFVRPEGQRVLPLETAVEYWTLLLADKFPSPELFNKWITFVTEVYTKAIPKDTWNMLLDFDLLVLSSEQGLDSYDAEAAWPSIFDDFVAYLKKE